MSNKKKDKSKQQKPASKTADQEAQPVNLCDDCAYEFGECEGKPKFASDQDKTLTGAEADRVIECPAFLDVAKMPTAQEAAAQSPAAAGYPGLILVCSGGCGKTTEGMTSETMSGEFKDREDGEVPEWTCQDCLNKRSPFDVALSRLGEFGQATLNARAGEIREEAERRFGPYAEPTLDEEADTLVLIVKEIVEREGGPTEEAGPEDQVIRTDLPKQPDPKRFQAEEDFGTCQSCERPLKRTALNRYRDAIRCTNGRCRAYRAIVKTISTGVK